MKRIVSLTVILSMALLALTSTATASLPGLMNYQGRLTDEGGAPLNDTLSMTFTIYSWSAGGSPVWTESHASVIITEGLFDVILGSVNPIDYDVFSDTSRWLQITVEGEDIEPRTRLVTAPYAFSVSTVNGAAGGFIHGYVTIQSDLTVYGKATIGPYHTNTGDYAFVAGKENEASGDYAFVAGYNNTASGDSATVGGGAYNTASGDYATVGGGWQNTASLRCNTVGGGRQNTATGGNTTVSGGGHNYASNAFSTIGGGYGDSATAEYTTIGGGGGNTASAWSATVGGGHHNTASGCGATVPGGYYNTAGGYFSFAAGCKAKALHDGAFVWADSTNQDFESTGQDQFLIRASGGVGIGTNSPSGQLHVETDKTYAGYFTSDSLSSSTEVIHAEFGATGNYDADAVHGKCKPADFWGYGGYFEGGYMGVYGRVLPTGANTYVGVRGYVSGGSGAKVGVSGQADGDSGTNYGVYGEATGAGTNYAGFFAGHLYATSASASIKAFKIDHPLDPESKYLYHSSVESPDMKNVYDGVVVLDASGEATVELPDYFEAVNKDFRYQLTAIGAPGPNLYVADKITNNSFKIAGGQPGMEVSWQVTGIRKDPFAQANRIQVEVDKPAQEQGKYLHPEAYGLGEEHGIQYEMHKRMEEKQREKSAQ